MNEEVFEQILFSCEEMCFSVALALSGNKNDARDIEQEILNRIWNLLDSEEGRMKIKKNIIKMLYNRHKNDERIDHIKSKNQNGHQEKMILRVVKNT